MMVVTFFGDPSAFLAVARPALAVDAVVSTVVSSYTHQVVLDPTPGPGTGPRWWATIHTSADPHQILGIAMRTPGHPPYLLPMPAAAATALATALLERGERPDGANGADEAARAFCAHLVSRYGGQVSTAMAVRLHRLDALVVPTGVPGAPRRAAAGDLDRLVDWIVHFHEDARTGELDGSLEQRRAQARTFVEPRVAAGLLWLWEDPIGTPVSLVGAREPAFGVCRIGPVFTPAAARRRGYAGALTAYVSSVMSGRADALCLFTDRANSTSNGVYRRIGYRPVVDMVNLRVVPDGA